MNDEKNGTPGEVFYRMLMMEGAQVECPSCCRLPTRRRLRGCHGLRARDAVQRHRLPMQRRRRAGSVDGLRESMKVLKPKMVLVEIGPLDHKRRLPMKGRIAARMKTPCAACGEEITDEFFVVGFKKGHPNMALHEACAEEG